MHKVYIDDESYNSGHGRAYEFYGVDPLQGAVVIVRPDQCEFFSSDFCLSRLTQSLDVSMVLPFEEKVGHEHQVIGNFFSRFCTQVPAELKGGP